MFIHLTPRIYLGSHYHPTKCDLLDVSIKELSLVLLGGTDLTSKSPYPNKNYLVACRKLDRKATIGFLVETKDRISSFTAEIRWLIDGVISFHEIHYTVLDNDFDMVSEDMILWHGFSPSLGGWSSRWPEQARGLTPASDQPTMDVWCEAVGGLGRGLSTHDSCEGERIVRRVQSFSLPTIERERLLTCQSVRENRYPALGSAFPQNPSLLNG